MRAFVSRADREQARLIARDAYTKTASRFIYKSENRVEIKRLAVDEARKRLTREKRYKSLLGSLLLMVVMKIVTKLIERWIEENLFTLEQIPVDYEKTEPGYVER
jgi:hypothetical protein